MSISLDFLFFMSCCLIWHVLFHPSILLFSPDCNRKHRDFQRLTFQSAIDAVFLFFYQQLLICIRRCQLLHLWALFLFLW